MIFEYGTNRLRQGGLSARPVSMLDPAARADLALLAEIDMIENGDAAARENWQGRQLVNLLRHASERSPFWRKRILTRSLTPQTLQTLPVQTRRDLIEQAEQEGSLMPRGGRVFTRSTSGSTGIPIKFHVTEQNGRYNSLRSLAQILMEGRSLHLNRVFVQSLDATRTLDGTTVSVERAASWFGPLGRVFENGHNKTISYVADRADAAAKELLKDPVGYLVCTGRQFDNLLDVQGVELFKKAQVRHWIHIGDSQDASRRATLLEAGISTLSNYSSEEVGPIGFECAQTPAHYHVAHSNVIVETDQEETAEIDGQRLGRLLITHLHSYATPLIRYDIGDMGVLLSSCPCGHQGPTLTAVHGRQKLFLRHPAGHLLKFNFVTKIFREIVNCSEISIRQTGPQTVLFLLKRQSELTVAEEQQARQLLSRWISDAFEVVIRVVSEIDWSRNPKRLLFINELP
jgi:phenylacetate-coenzyme A ligase PaaK-like adenylate-forming protein